jgi:exoribonuclease R
LEELGPVKDPHNYGKVIMRQNGVSFDKFPDKVVREAKALEKEFKDKILKKERKNRKTVDLHVLSIDTKNARALDDALSVRHIEGPIF